MKFPVTIPYRNHKAKIYAPSGKSKYYRVAYTIAGKRQMKTFSIYSDAKAAAERIVRDLATGSQASALTATQSRDALAALERLQGLFQSTGRQFSLLSAVSGFSEAVSKLQGRPLGEAIEGYLRIVVSVQRKDILEAVEEFIEGRKHKSEAKDGQRAQMSPDYAYNVAMWLREFANTFPNSAVSDLSREHLDAYIKDHMDVSAKSRNDRRATVKMFLSWAVRKDYLSVNHRLFESEGMARENVEAAETDFYRPSELQKLLENADDDLLPMIALGGLAGLRVEEIMRLEWSDVWRVAEHIEITAKQAKTRQRRLVEVCVSLDKWLTPYKKSIGKVWDKKSSLYQSEFAKLRVILKIPPRRNGLRHAYCTYHFALHANENLTAQQAGNSPAMIHAHYKGLATRSDGEKWFNVMPLIPTNTL